MTRRKPEPPPVRPEGAARAAVKGKILERLMGGPLTGAFLSGIVCGGLDLADVLGDLEANGQIRSCCAGRASGERAPCAMGHKGRATWRRAVWRLK